MKLDGHMNPQESESSGSKQTPSGKIVSVGLTVRSKAHPDCHFLIYSEEVECFPLANEPPLTAFSKCIERRESPGAQDPGHFPS